MLTCSAGAWAVDTLEHVSQREVKTYPVAYSIKPAGAKISRKDVLGTGKSDPFFKVISHLFLIYIYIRSLLSLKDFHIPLQSIVLK